MTTTKQKIFYLLDPSLCNDNHSQLNYYEISGTLVISNINISIANCFKVKHTFEEEHNDLLSFLKLYQDFYLSYKTKKTVENIIYHDKSVWIAGLNREMTVYQHVADSEEWLQFNVKGLNTCWLNISNDVAFIDNNTMNDKEILEYFLGPIYINLITKYDHYAFHASTLLDSKDNKAIIFVAESGTGKSTIASYLNNKDKQKGGDYMRISDDIIPTQVKLVDNTYKLFALPQYPQPKLNDDEQYCGASSIEVKAIIKLSPTTPAISENKVFLNKLTRSQAFLLTIRHGVATRSFNQKTLERHFNFCKIINESVPLFSLHYSRRLDIYPQIYQCLKNTLS